MKYLVLVMLLPILLLAQDLSVDKWSPINNLEQMQLSEMLRSSGLDSLSICFERDWDLATKFKTGYQIRMLNDPWFAMQELGNHRSVLSPDSSATSFYPLAEQYLGIALNLQSELSSDYDTAHKKYTTSLKQQKLSPKAIFSFVETWYGDVARELDLAFGALNPADRDSLYQFMIGSWSESEDKDKYHEFLVARGMQPLESFDLIAYASLFERVDLASIARAYALYHAGFDVLLAQIQAHPLDIKKPIYKQSKYGLLIIGSSGNDLYHNAAKHLKGKRIGFILDPGGNDVYELDINTDWQHPLYLVIDVQGNDIYRSNSPTAMFSSVAGIGFSYDASGDDSYFTDDFAFCSFLGINIHVDEQGNDTYRSGLYAQGAAMFGLCLLIDKSGSDSYSASSFAQGLGGTMGVGALVDYAGDDLYYIGGKYLHKPLMPNDYRSMGQGMGFGFRPDYAGGLGILYDKTGNDKYIGGVYAQGVAYWYAGGLLIDEYGNDVYNAIYYPQGSGIHLAYGMLFDAEGDDNYYTRNGPGQGAGHDWSLGILIDKSGNDAYSIPGGNGLGLSNSVGIFVDSSGDDRYERKDSSSLGFANLSRGTGGIGLFLDAGGKDSYPDTLFANDKSWQRGTYGIGKDMELNILEKTKLQSIAEEESALIDSLAAISEIYDIACEWEVGSAIKRVRKAREIMLSRHEEAADYIIEKRMQTKSGLEYRAMEELVQKSTYFRDKLFGILEDSDSLKVKNSMSLISATGDTLLIDFLAQLLHQKKYVTAALGTLGNIKTIRSFELLSEYMDHSSERYRFICARSLMNLKLPEAEALLERYRDDPSFIVRTLIRHRN